MAKHSKQYSNLFYRSVILKVITGSIARSGRRRYLIHSVADFEVFRPAGATRCTDGGEIWHWGGNCAKFHLHRCNNKGVGPQKLKFLLRIEQNVEYKGVSLARFSQNLQSLYPITGCVSC